MRVSTKHKKYVADFETNTREDNVDVWAVGLCEVGKPETFDYSNNIDFLFNFFDETTYIYFHNLAFDGEFIIWWLFRKGFTHSREKKLNINEFSTLISDTGSFYQLTVCLENDKGKPFKLVFYDSFKLIPFSVDKIAKDFKLPYQKLDLDYNTLREKGHKLTQHEVDYLKGDVVIMALALHSLFEQGMVKMTTASNALHNYKSMVGNKFDKWYPNLKDIDSDIRKSYKGGWTYVNPKIAEKIIKTGIVFDVNSLYPYVMKYKKLPFGIPIFYEGEYKEDKIYDVYIQKINVCFKIKKGYLPTIQLKNNASFIPNEYVKSSKGEIVTLVLTSIDLKLFLEHYDIEFIDYINGYKFKSSNILFTQYVDYWSKVKIDSKLKNDDVMYIISKLMLNSLYGKFAQGITAKQKLPVYNKEKDEFTYKISEEEEKDGLYIPIGSFITSYAREITIRACQQNFDRFLYADTDSMHLIGYEIPTLNISNTKLGYWKQEMYVKKGLYIRQKCYIEIGWNLKGKKEYIKAIAGLPKSARENINFTNFKRKAKFDGKLQRKRVKGGVYLKEMEFTIK